MHLINFKELSAKQLNALIDLGIEVKHKPEKYVKALAGKSLALVFQKTSTRTRVAFEVAMTQLGGHGLYIDWRTTNFTLADVYDETQYLSRNVDAIMARLLRNVDLQRMALASRVPVINGCDSLIEGCTKAGVKLTTVTPIVNEQAHDEELMEAAKKTGLWETTLDAKKAVKD